MISKYDWIHELIRTEEQIEETGVVDFDSHNDPDRAMIGAALTLLAQLRSGFNDAVEVFNEYKQSTASKIKVYSIAKTHADFMLFRNGFKLVFSLKQPGVISIRTHFMNPALPSVSSMNLLGSTVTNNLTAPQFRGEEELLEMIWGPFNETIWTYKKHPVKVESVIKYFLSKFVRDTSNAGF
jgi:hypothetical protein